MPHLRETTPILPVLDARTAALVRLAAAIAEGPEPAVREAFAASAAANVPVAWEEEVILQSYLFAGFPKALNAAREWRRRRREPEARGQRPDDGGRQPAVGAVSSGDGSADPRGGAAVSAAAKESYADVFDWRVRGEETCRVVYGRFYEKLRSNIRGLHDALDEWMIVEGYGKVLSRSGLDLARRELCVLAACAAAGQDRQLHSHLHGALNAGAGSGAISATLDALDGIVNPAHLQRARLLWKRVGEL